MLETIRQFAEEQLVESGESDVARIAHAQYFAGREADAIALWDGPGQHDAYEWFNVELPNLRSAFRWAAGSKDLETASAIAVYAAFLGNLVEQYEPIAWAEELIEPARAANHWRLEQLYKLAAQCYATGRLDDALRYAEAGMAVTETVQSVELPYEGEAILGGVYVAQGRPDRWVELCREAIAKRGATDTFTRVCLALALSTAGAHDEAMAVSETFPALADAVDNPHVASNALLAYGLAHHDADPAASYNAHRRGMKIAQDSGNRQLESYHAGNLSWLASSHGNLNEALDYATIALTRFYNTGHYSVMPSALAVLASILDRLGLYEAAATISVPASTPFARATYPEIHGTIAHLRDVLRADAFEPLARKGESMSNAALAAYALAQIDSARAHLMHLDEMS